MRARSYPATVLALTAAMLASACSMTPEPLDWRAYEAALYAEGRLRQDRAPPDAPFSNTDLARNFERIAFGLEPQLNQGSRGRGILRRWEVPVVWRLHMTGPGRATAAQDVAATFARLAAATGHPIAPASDTTPANLDILVLGPGDFAAAPDWISDSPSGDAGDLIDDFRVNGLPCMGQFRYRLRARADQPPGALTYAIVLVRKGFSRGFRLSCFEEELAQVMGLANDDARVRPSVFNDDEEFALLTTHDEMLLALLYDRRLRPGMRQGEAGPLVRRILADRVGG